MNKKNWLDLKFLELKLPMLERKHLEMLWSRIFFLILGNWLWTLGKQELKNLEPYFQNAETFRVKLCDVAILGNHSVDFKIQGRGDTLSRANMES